MASALTACSASAPVARIPHFRSSGIGDAVRVSALRSVYVLAEDPRGALPPPAGSLLGLIGQKAAREAYPGVEAAELAESAAAALRKAGAPTVTYRVLQLGERDPYLDLLKPTAVLRLRPGKVHLSSTSTTKEKEEKDSKGKVVKKLVTTWHMKARLALRAELTAWPGGRLLAETEAVSEAEGTSTAAPNLSKFRQNKEHELIKEAVREIVSRLTPESTTRVRPLHPGAAGWKASWNEAVRAEQGGRYADALALYDAARSSAAADAEAAKIDWAALRADLLPPSGKEPERGGASIFEPTVAVLPFSDETTSVDGPVAARKLVHRLLADGGYAVESLARVDDVLREHGFTQGGQLKGARPEKLAEWLGTDRLVLANLEYYQLMPASTVSGELAIWDAKKSANWHTAKVWGVSEEGVDGARALVKEVTGMSWTGILLLPTAETLRFARRALAPLPRRAKL